MMKFQSLKISNFGSISDVLMPLDNQGLVLITGVNKDAPRATSNGSGKSLLLDAFTWCLWGKTVRGLSGDEVINDEEGKNCLVEVVLEDSGRTYKVSRYRKNKSLPFKKLNDVELSCDGQDMTGSSVSETEGKIQSIVGLDFPTFCALMPGAGVNLAEMTDREIKGLLEGLLRTEVLGKAYEEARLRLRDLQKTLTTLEAEIGASESHLQTQAALSEKLTLKAEEWASVMEKKKQELVESLEAAEKEVDSIERHLEVLPVVDLQAARDEYSAASKLVDEVSSRLVEETKRLRELEIRSELGVSALKKESTVALKRLEQVSSLSGTCAECHQDIPHDHVEAVTAGIVLEIQELSQKLEEAQDTHKVLLEDNKKVLQKLTDEKDLHASAKKEKKEALLDAEAATNKKFELEKTLHFALKERSRIEATLDWDSDLPNEHQDSLDAIHASVEEIEALLLEKNKAATECRASTSDLEFWVEAFSPAGIRSFMLDRITPRLNAAAERYSNVLTDGEMSVRFSTKDILKSGVSKERFNIEVTHKHGGQSYLASSAGERARANLVVSLALGDLASLRANKSIPFRFLDEPFESIDESGVDAIVRLLNDQKDSYGSIFVITHQSYFKQLFDKKLTMVKSAGRSSWGTDE